MEARDPDGDDDGERDCALLAMVEEISACARCIAEFRVRRCSSSDWSIGHVWLGGRCPLNLHKSSSRQAANGRWISDYKVGKLSDNSITIMEKWWSRALFSLGPDAGSTEVMILMLLLLPVVFLVRQSETLLRQNKIQEGSGQLIKKPQEISEQEDEIAHVVSEHGDEMRHGGPEHGDEMTHGGGEHGDEMTHGGGEHGDEMTHGGGEHGDEMTHGGGEYGDEMTHGGGEHGDEMTHGGGEYGGEMTHGGGEHGDEMTHGGGEHGDEMIHGGGEHGDEMTRGGREQGRKKKRGRKHKRRKPKREKMKQSGSEQRDTETSGGPEQSHRNTRDEPEQVDKKTRQGSKQKNKKIRGELTGENRERQKGPEQTDKNTETLPHQGFFPGLPNDIVLDHIVTRLPWSSMYALVYVNQKWRSAIRSREVHNARERGDVLQSMVVAPVQNLSGSTGFYDVLSQKLWLFPFPLSLQYSSGELNSGMVPYDTKLSSDGFILHADHIAFVDEKMYVIRENRPKKKWTPEWTNDRTEEIYTLDVAACQAIWKKCSEISEKGPTSFWVACNGKLYAFHSYRGRMRGRIFDPKSHQWTEIDHRPKYNPSCMHCARDYHGGLAVLNERIYVALRGESGMMVFDTTVQRWHFRWSISAIDQTFSHADSILVVSREKLYHLSQSLVEVYNSDSNSWTLLQDTYHKDFIGLGNRCAEVQAVARYGDELVAVLRAPMYWEFSDGASWTFCKSVGFGKRWELLSWRNFVDLPVRNCEAFDYLML